jgi:DNA-binding response OmpR family regulator
MTDHTWNLPETEDHSVLLLEDDNALAGTLKEFLELNHCRVTRVTNGVEGLQKIIATDFDLILCDMVMATFPGDKFYVAVQRIRPRCCERFVFMTGHEADTKWDAFIRSVHGLKLWKPFPMHDLMAAMRIVFKRSREHELSDYLRAITKPPVMGRKRTILRVT